jgi:hypothetical protein
VTRYTLTNIADQFQHWVKERAAKRNIPIVEAPKGRCAALASSNCAYPYVR